MSIQTNELIEYFATSTIEFRNAFQSTLPAGKLDANRKTAFEVCGLIIPLKGSARFSLNGVPYHMNPHTIVHAGKDMTIKIKTYDQDWTYAVLHYEVIQPAEKFAHFTEKHFSIEIDQMQPILKIVDTLLHKNMNPDHFSQFELKALFMNLLQEILNGARNSEYNFTLQQVTKIIDYFHTHYEEGIFISEVADMFQIDRRRIAYLFEKITGMTPVQYLMHYRVSRAKELLAVTDLTVAQISEAVGYQDNFYFSRVFKKVMHISPSQYRKQNQRMGS